jgi:hybrid cluster-associated redox disulfide protein
MIDYLEITADSFVDEIMTKYPGTISVFLRRRMSCVGCLMGPFHTVYDAAEEYEIATDVLLEELRHAAAMTNVDPEQRQSVTLAENGGETNGVAV